MAIYPIKVLLDKNRKPFIPYVALETVLVDESNTTLAELLNGMYTMDEVNALLENEISKFDVYPDEASLPAVARDGNVAVVEDGENYFMFFYFDGGWYKLTQQGPAGDKGEDGATGNSGVYTGPEEPTDPDVSIWIDTSDETVVLNAEGSSF